MICITVKQGTCLQQQQILSGRMGWEGAGSLKKSQVQGQTDKGLILEFEDDPASSESDI